MMSLKQLVVLALLMSPFALAEEYEILTTWDSKPIDHDPVIIRLESAGINYFNISVDAPFFNDPPPSGQPGDPFYGLWEYEVVEIFFLNDDDQYVEIELSPWGQHLVLFLNGRRKTICHSLFIDFKVSRSGKRWQGEAIVPKDFLPRIFATKMNAYAIHGVGSSRVYESLYPVPSGSATEPDFHKLEAFQPFNSSIIGTSVVENNEYSIYWYPAFHGYRELQIEKTWNGNLTKDHNPYLVIEARSNKGLAIGINAPFYEDVVPPPTPSGWPSGILSSYEVFHVFFYGTDNRCLELQFGPYGHYDVVFWVDQQTSVKDLTDFITFQHTGSQTYFWRAAAVIPFSYLPPGVSKVNAHYVHGPAGNRTILSLYPKESSATNQNLHDQNYAKAFDMSMLYPGNEKTECSSIWASKTGSNCPNPIQNAGNVLASFSLILLTGMAFLSTLANQMY